MLSPACHVFSRPVFAQQKAIAKMVAKGGPLLSVLAITEKGTRNVVSEPAGAFF